MRHKKMLLYLLIFIGLDALTTVAADCNVIYERYPSGNNTNIFEAMNFLVDSDRRTAAGTNIGMKAGWFFQSGETEKDRQIMEQAMEERWDLGPPPDVYAASFAWKDFKEENELVYRWFKSQSTQGEIYAESYEARGLEREMTDIFTKAKVCSLNSTGDEPCDLSLDPELTEIFISSRDETELKYYWSQFREETGKKMLDKYIRLVEISNEVACLKGFKDTGEYWRESYESETFTEEIEELWQTIKPIYEQLHAYVRRKLMQHYPHLGIKADGPIPAHLFGSISASSWNNIFDIVQPYPYKNFSNEINMEIRKKLTPLDMFEISEDFFTSLGLPEMTPKFWHYSIIEKPKDREIACHPSAWNFFDGKDYRIKMCTRKTMKDLLIIHHEMGHIIYDMLYSHQLIAFQKGANPGFHEAIGETIMLSASTPKHLSNIGLTDEVEESYENDINALMATALYKIAFLPYGYLVDSWRWKVFEGNISTDELNLGWWNLRLEYQGMCPPVRRTNDDFDPGSKYHVAVNVPYIRYFVSHIIQFQFHKALCDASGYEGPLHKCNIYGSKKAGKLLSDMLSLGGSVHWHEAMRVITQYQSSKMDASALIEYFNPLIEWLKEENKDEFIGWKSNDPLACP